jgi:soluble cytochrome b562
MKKEFAFLVLAIFLISAVSFAIAENESHRNNNSGEREDKNDSSNNDTLTAIRELEKKGENAAGGMRAAVAGWGGLKSAVVQRFITNHPDIVQKFLDQLNQTNRSNILEHLDRARLEKCLNNTEDCKEKIKDWKVKEFKVKDFLKKRFIDYNKLLKARDDFLKAKNKYLETKNNQLKVRNEFMQLKLRLAECKVNNTNCSALENQTFEKAQEDLNKIADRLIEYLQKVKSKAEGSENLNETEVSDFIDNIDAMIAKLDDAKDKVDAADTKAELQAASKMIMDVWKDMSFKAFFYADKIIHARVGEIFARSELLEKKLDVVISKLENKSINVTDLQDLLDNFSAKIDDARTKMTQANKLFAEAKDLRAENKTTEAKAKLEQAKNLTLEAHQDLKDAHAILMDLVHKINQKGESFNPDEINEEDEVEIVQEED